MRIVIDLQAIQSGSRLRGIGRYALALTEALIRQKGNHEIILVLSGLFPKTILPLKALFKAQIPEENIFIWYAPTPIDQAKAHDVWYADTAKKLREAFLANLKPDIVLITSLFEGHEHEVITNIGCSDSNAITSIGYFDATIPTAVILYDLIPLLYPKLYLTNPQSATWYHQKIKNLEKADLILAISDSAKHEVTTTGLTIDPNIIVNIGSAAEQHFQKITLSQEVQADFENRYQLKQDFLMYTGGIDPRKNIEGLIRSFAQLPKTLRDTHQLAIVCQIKPHERECLMKLISAQGLSPEQVIITGYVPEEDLVIFYNLCKVFIFPSWHEGFGLPILEAMMCGAPVIGSNTSSMPEVIGREDALFDPYEDDAITEKITMILTNETFRNSMIEHGKIQAQQFSWDKTARKALDAFTAFQKNKNKTIQRSDNRPKLAYISPIPPEKSGIAQYSATLIPALSTYYDIDIITTTTTDLPPELKPYCVKRNVVWLKTHRQNYHRILYHMGNSTFHTHMLELLNSIPGVVVLHDFYLSDILRHLEYTQKNVFLWSEALYYAHGYHALRERYQANTEHVKCYYPSNKKITDQAMGMIVHSQEALDLGEQWLGTSATKSWFHVPSLQTLGIISQHSARERLKLDGSDFVVCSFGYLASSKQNHMLLKAWHASMLMHETQSLLIFVGEAGGEYGAELVDYIKKNKLEDRVLITGWVDDTQFKDYLAAADLSVQLRTGSRGETSAAVLACMAYGIPTIVNAHGTMKELPKEAVWMLNDDFQQQDLVEALNTLFQNPDRRFQLSKQATTIIQQQHTPEICARHYYDAIEASYANQEINHALLKAIKPPIHVKDLLLLSESISMNSLTSPGIKQLFIDVSHWNSRQKDDPYKQDLLEKLIHNPPKGYRIEPIYTHQVNQFYRYARRFMLKKLSCPEHILKDEIISIRPGDCYLTLSANQPCNNHHREYLAYMQRRGVKLYFAKQQASSSPNPSTTLEHYLREQLPDLAWHHQVTEIELSSA